ncbi:MAG: DNA repair protein RadA [Candidatus Amesbacteria bacterium]|nr:DNA repair protein RadA [Candidatus Amesbacteria bacterium]
MAKSKSQFVCQQCGYSQSQWAGKCPSCDVWNSMVETTLENRKQDTGRRGGGQIFKLQEIKIDENKRQKTGELELDNVLGGGLVPGMVVLVAGEPGIGKSTLLLQVALKCQGLGAKCQVLYICGEESTTQVALRAKRLSPQPLALSTISLLETNNVDEAIAKINETKPKVVIVDSIQSLVTEDLTGGAGSVGQVRECAQRLASKIKDLGSTIFIVGQVTKDGNIAGPRVLEHLVDTVLWFEGDRSSNLRLVRAIKNRFGATDEVGVFEMSEAGLIGVSDPSKLLLTERVTKVPGSVVSVILEGRRPLLVEIQALTTPSQLSIPRRVAIGIDTNRLQMLVAILIRRAGLNLGDQDIFVNVTGGIKLADRGVDLAICMAVASSFLNKPMPEDVAAVGEVGLMGEVRKVTGLDKRIKEAKKLGYRVASAESGKSVSSAISKLLH